MSEDGITKGYFFLFCPLIVNIHSHKIIMANNLFPRDLFLTFFLNIEGCNDSDVK